MTYKKTKIAPEDEAVGVKLEVIPRLFHEVIGLRKEVQRVDHNHFGLCMHTTACQLIRKKVQRVDHNHFSLCMHTSAYVSIRQHMSAYQERGAACRS